MWNLNNPYRDRDDNLHKLGFDSYRDYLRSQLWEEISFRVFRRTTDGRCECCRFRRASQIHHRAYDISTLRGDCIDALTALCDCCHYKAERPTKRQSPYDRLTKANEFIARGQTRAPEQPESWKKKHKSKRQKHKVREVVWTDADADAAAEWWAIRADFNCR
jgi:hypothetical protein